MKRKSTAILLTVFFCFLLLASGAASAKDNGDGTVTINGLVWLKNSGSCLGSMTWDSAMSGVPYFKSGSCPGLKDNSQAGDWRLPTKDELVAVYSHVGELGTVWKDYHWSSTTAYGTSAYIVNLKNGGVSTFSKTSSQYSIPVRQPK
ncbi:MAG: DUF1566 domain-containing protein [Deltaproteobacteria bacterium]|nr:DUF1566 domain-containing protein [Syntrophaceae bacterium]